MSKLDYYNVSVEHHECSKCEDRNIEYCNSCQFWEETCAVSGCYNQIDVEETHGNHVIPFCNIHKSN